MSNRIQGKVELYAHLLEKLHIISEQEKQQLLQLNKSRK